MKLRIQSINFVATQALESYVTKKTKKLNRLLDDIINVEVYLKVVKPETATNKEAEIKISVPSAEFFASKVCDTFEEAVDLSLEALERQIVKFKEKLIKK
jgi:putative sigma-54 modulation protein